MREQKQSCRDIASPQSAILDPASPRPANGDAKFVGSKGGAGVWQQIVSQMPPHWVYVEPFLGTGVVMRKKRPAGYSIGVEIDAAVANQFDAKSVPGSRVIIGDGIKWLRDHDWKGAELVYCDPPYLLATRKHRVYYGHELSDLDHLALLKVLRSLPCKVILSGYWSELYGEKLRDWRTMSFTTTTRGGGRVTEWIWMNFPEPFEFHDTRFLGRNFRERERIRRKKHRWIQRLKTMPVCDRAAILDAIDELRSRSNQT